MINIATHPCGVEIIADLAAECRSSKFPKKLLFYMPRETFEVTTEHLENSRSLVISKCTFFENYIGVVTVDSCDVASGHIKRAAKIKASRAAERFLSRLSNEGNLFEYLLKRGFKFTIWGSSNLNLFINTRITIIPWLRDDRICGGTL